MSNGAKRGPKSKGIMEGRMLAMRVDAEFLERAELIGANQAFPVSMTQVIREAIRIGLDALDGRK